MVGDVEGLGWEGVGTGLGKASLKYYGPFPNPRKHKKQSHIFKFPRHVNRFQIALFRVAPRPRRTVLLFVRSSLGALGAHFVLYTAEGEFFTPSFTYFHEQSNFDIS